MVNIRDIVDVLQKDLRKKGIPYLSQVKQINSNLMITCPYHKNGQESSPSCGILLNDRASHTKVHKAGTVHCFTCGETHTLEEMISHVYGKHDKGQYGKEWLLEHFQLLSTSDITFDFDFTIQPIEEKEEVDYKRYLTDKPHPYFITRGLDEKIVRAFNLGYDEVTDSVVVPLFDKQGKCIMLIKRAIAEHVYMNTSGASKTDSVYGIHMVYQLLDKLVEEPYIYIVEGPFDVLKMWQNGYPAVGIMQASISENQINLINKLPFQKVVIATDNDDAGKAVAKKLADKLGKTKEVYRLIYPLGVKDPGDIKQQDYRKLEVVEFYGKKDRHSFSIY